MTHSGQKDSLRMWFLLLPHVHSLFPPIKPYHFSTGTSYCWLGSTCAGRERMYLHSQAFPIWYLMLCCCVAFIACNTGLVCNLTWWHRGWGGWVCCNLLELSSNMIDCTKCVTYHIILANRPAFCPATPIQMSCFFLQSYTLCSMPYKLYSMSCKLYSMSCLSSC